MVNTILTDYERRKIHRKAALAPSAVDALIAETEAAVLAKLREQEPQHAWSSDASNWGAALNSASWEFINSYRIHMGEAESPKLFNTIKTILRDAILCYSEKIAAVTQAEQADRIAELEAALEAYEAHGVTCQTFRHFVDTPCAECNVRAPEAPQAEQAADRPGAMDAFSLPSRGFA